MASRPRPRRGLLALAAALALALIALASSARFYTDLLWFEEVGLTSVLWRSIGIRVLLGVLVGVATAAVVWGNLWLAARLAPAYALGTLELGRADPLTQYRETLLPYARWLRLGLALLTALIAGVGASASWRVFLLWLNRVPFRRRDPQFGLDIGFYVFELPFFRLVLSWLWLALIASLLLAAAAHLLYGSIRPDRAAAAVSSRALAHLSALLALLALVKAARYWLGRYGLNFSGRGTVVGASYTDVNAQLPALTALTVIAIVAAGLFLVNIRARRVSLPIAAIGLWILVSVLAGGLWPWWVQRFSVEPQELQRERPYIARNIEATRRAFGLSQVRTEAFEGESELSAEEVRANEAVLRNVRVWDPDILQTAYSQLQAIRLYYEFEDVDIDRYEVDGELRQVLLSARELNLEALPEGSATWANIHLGYTHGFGVVASLANEATGAGQPSFLVKDVPGEVRSGAEEIELQQPRIYYGESFDSAQYSVVDSRQPEIDFPTDQGVERFRYDGGGGVPVGGLLRRVMFALREGDPNLILSSLITGDSQILLYRNVRDRVLRAAPFLYLDHDPYIAAVDGRLTWILDAYTATPWYPYSQRFALDELVGESDAGVLQGVHNYVRNPVKITVDAYDGTMRFYIIDETDPLIAAWRHAFPELFEQEPPGDELRAHFRYPEDLFELQSEVYLSYHMTDPDNFYQREDEWALALNPLEEDVSVAAEVPPTYLLFRLPGATDQEFMLSRAFTPRQKNNMNALLVGRSDPDNYGELVTLELPRQEFIAGPKQVSNLINQDVLISRTRTLLGQEGSQIIFGSLVILPIEDSILYVQPFFVKASDIGIPELKRVIVVFGEEVVMGETFEQALALLFDTDEPPERVEPVEPDGEPAPAAGRLAELIARANELYGRAQQALSRGDFAGYARLIEELGELLEQAETEAGVEASPGGRD